MATQEMYEQMARWSKFKRRHEANVFNALFYDKENVTEEEINSIISEVATFFNLPQPEIKNKCETFAEVLLGKDAYQCELAYNIEMLQKTGINNKDAFTLCFVHEMAHQLLYKYRFMLFCNERWIQELAADMTAGLYAERHHLSTGKFKYALSVQRYSITHPDGRLRETVVECGRHQLEFTNVDGSGIMQMVVRMMPAFVYSHYDVIKKDWQRLVEDLEAPPVSPKQYAIEDLPDTNLLKQMVMKYRTQKK